MLAKLPSPAIAGLFLSPLNITLNRAASFNAYEDKAFAYLARIFRIDLPPNFHPVAIRVSAILLTTYHLQKISRKKDRKKNL